MRGRGSWRPRRHNGAATAERWRCVALPRLLRTNYCCGYCCCYYHTTTGATTTATTTTTTIATTAERRCNRRAVDRCIEAVEPGSDCYLYRPSSTAILSAQEAFIRSGATRTLCAGDQA